jgi:uroporphyrinogen III methyltransferase / synthase
VTLGAPATIVVGAVAGLDLGGRRSRPLSGWTVVVTRPRGQSEELIAALTDAGAAVVALPVIAISGATDARALAKAAERVGDYDWIVFSSANAVDRFVGLLRDGRALAGVRLAAVGPATAAALAAHHLLADLVPEEATAEGLVAAMPSAPPAPAGSAGGSAGRVLFPRAAAARDVIAPGLRAKGWEVDEVEAYRTVTAGADDGATDDLITAAVAADVITFSSPSTVDRYLELSAGRVPAVVACIGPVTADAARKAGLVVDVEAEEHTSAGLVAALVATRETFRK